MMTNRNPHNNTAEHINSDRFEAAPINR